MSIKLIMPTEIAGVSTPVTGNVLTLGAELEAKLVGTRRAVWVDNGVTNLEPLQVSKNLTGGIELSAGGEDITNLLGGDGESGAALTFSARNISHVTPTKILLPSAPLELAIMWSESGTSGNLRYVLEAASLADATARLSDDSAHAELVSNSNPALISFEPTMSPVNIYFMASSAVGAGSSTLSAMAKVVV